LFCSIRHLLIIAPIAAQRQALLTERLPQAVCIGRPYLWGLGAFGQAGVERVLEILRKETRDAMQEVGAPSIKHLTPAMVQRA
jgi:FMN-dependent dehydrogenase